MHIKKLNWGYKSALAEKDVKYYNKLGKIVGKNSIELTDKNGAVETVTAKYIIIAVGGRPSYLPNVPKSGELCMTSDDIFWRKENPGKVLVVGASYIALECAGFLAGLGYDVTGTYKFLF